MSAAMSHAEVPLESTGDLAYDDSPSDDPHVAFVAANDTSYDHTGRPSEWEEAPQNYNDAYSQHSDSHDTAEYHNSRAVTIDDVYCRMVSVSNWSSSVEAEDSPDALNCRKVGTGAASNWASSLIANRPDRPPEMRRPIRCRLKVNGVEANVLLDPGSEVDMVSPSFLENANVRPIVRELRNPLQLNMAVTGSRASVNYGAWLDFSIGPFEFTHYCDIQNCHKIDVMLGLPSMTRYKMSVCLNPEDRHFTIRDLKFPDRFGYPDVKTPIRRFRLVEMDYPLPETSLKFKLEGPPSNKPIVEPPPVAKTTPRSKSPAVRNRAPSPARRSSMAARVEDCDDDE
jgi:hypothetical protein